MVVSALMSTVFLLPNEGHIPTLAILGTALSDTKFSSSQ